MNSNFNNDLRQAIREYLHSCTAGYQKPRITPFALSKKYKNVGLSTISRRIKDLKVKSDQYIQDEQIEHLLDELVRPLGRKPAFDRTALKDLHVEVQPLLETSSCKKRILEEVMLERRKSIAAARGFNPKWVRPFCHTTYSKYRNEIAPEMKVRNRKANAKAVVCKPARAKKSLKKHIAKDQN